MKKRFLSPVDAVLNPTLEPKGMDWEYLITEAPRDLWKINRLAPTEAQSEGEKKMGASQQGCKALEVSATQGFQEGQPWCSLHFMKDLH